MSISVDDVESLRSILSALPRHQPKQVSKQEAIASLVSELAAAQRRGYSADDLARLMSEKGIEINGPTLRNCLRRLRKKRRARDKPQIGEVSAGPTPAASSASSGQKNGPADTSASTSRLSMPSPVGEAGLPKPDVRAVPPLEARVPQK